MGPQPPTQSTCKKLHAEVGKLIWEDDDEKGGGGGESGGGGGKMDFSPAYKSINALLVPSGGGGGGSAPFREGSFSTRRVFAWRLSTLTRLHWVEGPTTLEVERKKIFHVPEWMRQQNFWGNKYSGKTIPLSVSGKMFRVLPFV